MSSPGAPASAPHRRQKRMGPAPFASFEDLSDELDSPEDKNASASVVRLPGIREDVTPCSPAPFDQIKPEFCYTGISIIGAPSTPTVSPLPPIPKETKTTLQAPAAPRIDISRASSSSHHDSKDSSPEREEGGKFGMEEGALEMRLSTEELDYQGQQQHHQQRVKQQQQQQQQRAHSPTLHEDSYHSHNRKDSQSSEIGLLCISGRTSRLSSIGSQGSAHSRISNASHLSVISGQSGASRSPSPHKMLLETSFCGTKPQKKAPTAEKDEGTKDDLETVLLKRQHDPTQVLIAEGITVDKPKDVKPEKPARKFDAQKITITVDKPGTTNDVLKPKLPKRIVAESGIEYIYIPLTGPLPEDTSQSTNGTVTKPKVRETKSATLSAKPTREPTKQKSKSASPSPVVSRHHHHHQDDDDPKYIRIKLKPDHMYEDDSQDVQKPISLNLDESTKCVAKKAQTFEEIIAASPQYSAPKLPTLLKEPPQACSKSPSPSLSRKSSFASIFKSRETISPESPTLPGRRKNLSSTAFKKEGAGERRRSRSKSRDRTSLGPSSTESIDSKGKPKSVFSLFKSKKGSQRELDRTSPELPNLESLMSHEHSHNKKAKMKARTEAPLEGNSIRIPLHSPTYYDQKSLLQDFKTSSQDSQDTVIEVKPSSQQQQQQQKQEQQQQQEEATCTANQSVQNTRQNSSSSENLVFSTRLGSNNDIFTTKFPKDKYMHDEEEENEEKSSITTAIVEPEPITLSEPTTYVNKFQSQPTTPILAKTKIIASPGEIRKPVVVSLETKASKSPSPIEEPPPPVVMKIAHVELNTVKKKDSLEKKKIDSVDSKSKDDSSGSEHEFEVSPKEEQEQVEPERKGLVMQQDSYEDEFPYIPTTLPQERSVAVPIVPIKERSSFEMRTIPVERPRSTTPLNPTFLEEYRDQLPLENVEKLKISLPRDEGKSHGKVLRSPRRNNGSGQWFDFSKVKKEDAPPPLPPKGAQKEWINFEEIPEKRKAPKRIQTIPSRGNIEVPEAVLQENVIYTYVNPEDCKCECHERVTTVQQQQQPQQQQQSQQEPQHQSNLQQHVSEPEEEPLREDELPLLEDDPNEDSEKLISNVDRIKVDVTILDRRSIVSDSSVDLSTNMDPNGISLQTPFTSDLGVSSNRSSIISQDDAQSPDTDSPNAFPKTT